MIKAVIFDIGGVLLTTILGNMARDLAEKHSMDFETIHRKIHGGWNDYKLGKITADQFWQSFIESTGINETADGLKEMSLTYIKRIPGIIDVVKKLKENYKLGVLSNNVEEWMEKIRGMIDLKGLFDVVISSHKVGMAKPHKDFFMLCLEKLGNLKPEECLFVDDRDKNIEAAKEIGFNAIKFENPEQLKKGLQAMGVL